MKKSKAKSKGKQKELKLDLGCGPNKEEGYVGVDLRSFSGVDLIADLSVFPWKFKSNSVEDIRASHFLEHLPDILRTMNEIFRVLKPGGIVQIDVPSTNGMGAFQDPTHRSFWNLNTFLYFDKKQAIGSLYGCNVWEIIQAQEYNVNGIQWFGPYVRAILRKPDDVG